MRISKYHEMVDKEYSLLTVKSIFKEGRNKRGSFIYKCICDCKCGKQGYVTHCQSVRNNRTTSCGCRRDQYSKITGKNSKQFRGYEEIRSHFWRGYEASAKQKGLTFTITKEFIYDLFLRQNKKCILSGVDIYFGTTASQKNTTVSIDRIDSSKGYEKDNVQLVHKIINIMKNTLSNTDFIQWCKRVIENAN